MKFNTSIRTELLFIRLYKIYRLIHYPKLLLFVIKGIFPSFEHESPLRKIGKLGTLVDCGSNKGQFAIISYFKNKFREYIAFDPIRKPKFVISFFKKKGIKTKFEKIAISDSDSISDFFITERDDSSSLKKPKDISSNYFSDVKEINHEIVKVCTLDNFLNTLHKTPSPRLLKIDVQGNEYEVLKGAQNSLNLFKYIIVEVTYFNLYEDINFSTSDVHKLLLRNNFKLVNEYNLVKRKRELISADRFYLNIG